MKVTNERIDRTTKIIEDVLESVTSGQSKFNVKVIASITGQLISMKAAVGHAITLTQGF